MIAEGPAFEAFVRLDLFLQKVVNLCHDGRLAHLFDDRPGAAEIVFAHDVMWRWTDADVRAAFERFTAPRVLITEVFRERGLSGYIKACEGTAYRFFRGRHIQSPVGEIVAMEFIRKD